MRIDRLTSKLQLALSDAQSIAVGLDHPSIEPLHLMQALLEQQGGSIKPLLMQVGFDINALRQALTKELDQLPKLQNPTGDMNLSQDLARLLNQADRLSPAEGRPVHLQRTGTACRAGQQHPFGQAPAGPGREQEGPGERHQQPARWRGGQ